MRLLYHKDMDVLRQADICKIGRTRCASSHSARLDGNCDPLMQEGATPSVSDVADAAQVSRATAYRYFASQSALVDAVVDEALGPILEWSSTDRDVERRVIDLFEASLPRINEFEATFRAALKLSLEHKAKEQAGALGSEPSFKRGHRVKLVEDALDPLRTNLSPSQFEQLVQGLSLLFGIESLVILKDINGLQPSQAQAVTQWAAIALVRTAIGDANLEGVEES